MIPDSYDPFPCASGKKFKFCCKKIFREIVCAMGHAEERNYKEALKWMDKAKSITGEPPEVLCRYAVVHSFFDNVKAEEYLSRCLSLCPTHPRANYIRGLHLRNQGRLKESVEAYQMAIANYPATDRFHLNETWNNLANVYYDLKDYENAKSAWEKALFLLPSDRVTRENLGFIYLNALIPESLRKMSALVERFLKKS